MDFRLGMRHRTLNNLSLGSPLGIAIPVRSPTIKGRIITIAISSKRYDQSVSQATLSLGNS